MTCEICDNAKGGVPGNENIIEGRVVCDYCHADGSYRTNVGSDGLSDQDRQAMDRDLESWVKNMTYDQYKDAVIKRAREIYTENSICINPINESWARHEPIEEAAQSAALESAFWNGDFP